MSGGKRPSWNRLEKHPKGELTTQFTKVQTKKKLGPCNDA